MVDDRTHCPYGAYYLHPDGVLACRCLICARCNQHTGNTLQGHYTSLCRSTRGIRRGHFCCPEDCELPTDTSSNSTAT